MSKTLYIIIDSNVCLCQGAVRGQGSIVRGLRTSPHRYADRRTSPVPAIGLGASSPKREHHVGVVTLLPFPSNLVKLSDLYSAKTASTQEI